MVARSVRYLVTGWVVCSLLSGTATRLPAQRVALGGAPEDAVKTVVVTVSANAAPLKRVLNDIAQQAKLNPVYSDGVAQSTVRVTLHLRDVPATEAFQKVLSGTEFMASIVSGNVIIERAVSVAQESGTITGRVTNGKTKQPIIGATVSLDESKEVRTDELGTFRLTVVPGTHNVVVRAVGFVRQSRQITVEAQGNTAAAFALEPSASVLDEVVVTGTVVATERKAIPTPITVVTAADIERQNITRLDQLFRGQVPGVVALERGTTMYSNTLGSMASSNVYARGSASLDGKPTPLKTYVDGVELLDPAYLGTLDPKSIERIEIIAGPQAATIYGSGAMGGVMQIFTKKGGNGAAPEFTLNVRYGAVQSNVSPSYTPSHDHAVLVTGGSGAEFTYSGSLSYSYLGQWQPYLFNRTSGASIGATHTRGKITASGSVSLTAGKNGTQGSGYSSYCLANSLGCYPSLLMKRFVEDGAVVNPSAVAVYDYSQQLSTSSSQNLALTVDYRLARSWQHHLTVGRSQNSFGIEPQAPMRTSASDSLFRTSSSSGQRTTASYNMTLLPSVGVVSSSLTLGGNSSWASQTQLNGCLSSKNATAYVGCSKSQTPGITKSLSDKNWGGFGSAQMGLFDQLFFTAALRGERNPNYGDAHKIDWTPTTGVTYTAELGSATVKLLASYGRATRPPAASQRDELMTIDPNGVPGAYVSQLASPDLTPEYSRGPQGGIEVYYGNIGSITINRYVQKVTNLIQKIPSTDSTYILYPAFGFGFWVFPIQYMNTATTRQQGWSGTGSLNLGPVSLKGTYSWDDTRVLSVNPKAAPGGYSPGQSFYMLPTHSGSILASYARGATSVSLLTNYVGSSNQYYNFTPDVLVASNGRLPMYATRRIGTPFAYGKQGYVKSDMTVSQRLTPWASATLNIKNLSNGYDSDYGNIFPSLGRQTLFGLSLRSPR